MRSGARLPLLLGTVLLGTGLLGACSVRRLAVNGLADALAGSAETFMREDDPELVRAALPFALKSMEAVLLQTPDDEGLLLAASAGFGLYAYAFVELDAKEVETRDWAQAEALRARARALYLRARDYALRVLEAHHPGIGAALRRAPDAAVRAMTSADVAAAYWSGGTWGLAIALGKDDPALLADLDAVRALLGRSLELDEAWSRGALHEAMISIEALPRVMGGSPERARAHFERARELSGGRRASLFVSLAENVCVPAQDRTEFEERMRQALAIDLDAAPDLRLSNRIAQEHAREALQALDELFLPAPE